MSPMTLDLWEQLLVRDCISLSVQVGDANSDGVQAKARCSENVAETSQRYRTQTNRGNQKQHEHQVRRDHDDVVRESPVFIETDVGLSSSSREEKR